MQERPSEELLARLRIQTIQCWMAIAGNFRKELCVGGVQTKAARLVRVSPILSIAQYATHVGGWPSVDRSWLASCRITVRSRAMMRIR